MKRFFMTVLAILLVVALVAGCTAAPAQSSEAASSSSAPATSSAAESSAVASTSAANSNNDDLMGEGLGDDLGFGPVGYDMKTLVERMGDKAHKSLIAIQMQQMNEPWNQMFYDTLKSLGEKYSLNLIFNNAENDVTKEAAQMDSAVNQGAAGVILFYIDPTSCVPAIDKAVDAGVPVIPCFPAPESKASLTIGDSEVERGKFVAQQILKDFEGKKMTAVIANIPGQYGILDQRIEGFEAVLTEAEKTGNVVYLKKNNLLENDADSWTQSTIDLIASNEDVNCIIAAYGAPAVYCAAGVKQSGKDVKVYGIDADLSMCQKIKDGEITGLFPYDAKSNAYMCLFSMLRLVNGDKNVPNFSYAKQYATMWLTKANVEDYAKKQFGEDLK
jgi:ABC-type sugar transport system substrate-binding protein